MPRCSSAELFYLLLLQQRRGAASFGELQSSRGQNTYIATAPAYTQRALHGAHISGVRRGTTTSIPRSGYTRVRRQYFMFSLPIYHAEFLTILSASPLCFSRVLPAFRLFLRARLSHIQAGQCGSQNLRYTRALPFCP
jgi:hypothetical protein